MQEDFSLKETDFPEGYIAVIDKPLEWTSTDVVRKIKFALRKCGHPKIKVGHAGTLDPLATGVLLVCIGKATKRVEELQAERKEYVAELELGATTPSGDMEPEIDAKKIEGVRAYDLARAGESVELRRAPITVYAIELLEYDMPRIKIRVECSKGTYIRSLAFEIGEALSSGAYLRSLRRTRSGGYTAEGAASLDLFMEKLRECETKSAL